jgi:hypothetical protein
MTTEVVAVRRDCEAVGTWQSQFLGKQSERVAAKRLQFLHPTFLDLRRPEWILEKGTPDADKVEIAAIQSAQELVERRWFRSFSAERRDKLAR